MGYVVEDMEEVVDGNTRETLTSTDIFKLPLSIG
jgi:hypothetical protein